MNTTIYGRQHTLVPVCRQRGRRRWLVRARSASIPIPVMLYSLNISSRSGWTSR